MESSSRRTDLEAIFTKGGADRIALLRHCVKSITLEPMFVFLVQEYVYKPRAISAVALYDLFCAPNAIVRLRALRGLPPRDLRLPSAIEPLRRQIAELQSRQALVQQAEDPDSIPMPRVTTPFLNLFDVVVAAIREDPDGPMAKLAQRYDPSLDPVENLPGGKMTMAQLNFVDRIWKPRVRPALVAAGFWQLSSID